MTDLRGARERMRRALSHHSAVFWRLHRNFVLTRGIAEIGEPDAIGCYALTSLTNRRWPGETPAGSRCRAPADDREVRI
jgi:hypothetical protein